MLIPELKVKKQLLLLIANANVPLREHPAAPTVGVNVYNWDVGCVVCNW